KEVFDLDVIVPSAADRRVVHDVIYNELVAGEVLPESRAAYRRIIARLIAQGAQAIILGCTEIMLLVSEEDSAVPLLPPRSMPSPLLIAHWRHRTFGSGGSNVRYGSLADISQCKRDVRFTPKSGHVQRNSACLLCANSGHSRVRLAVLAFATANQ